MLARVFVPPAFEKSEATTFENLDSTIFSTSDMTSGLVVYICAIFSATLC